MTINGREYSLQELREKAYRLRELIEKASATLTDEEALDGIELFPRWSEESKAYSVNNRVSYEGTLFKCLQNHTSQSSWTPADAPSLWVRVDNPADEWPEWIQPLGSTDAYPLGAKVSYDGKHWISDIDNNIWAPGVYGWSEVA